MSGTTTTTTTSSSSPQQQQQQKLDFRNIHEHPPEASAKAAKQHEELIDPSWDAHKVYFNEHVKVEEKTEGEHDGKKKKKIETNKGDEFDDFFNDSNNNTSSSLFNDRDLFLNEKKEDDIATAATTTATTLDPLGWPIDAFRSLSERVQSTLTINGLRGGDDDDVDDRDDMNLLPNRNSDYNCEEEDILIASAVQNSAATPIAASKTTTTFFVGGVVVDATTNNNNNNQGVAANNNDNDFVETFLPDNSTGDGNGNDNIRSSEAAKMTIMNKEERIRMYESRGIDDESSVEEDNENEGRTNDDDDYDEKEWEESQPNVEYVAQTTTSDGDYIDDEEGVEIDMFSHTGQQPLNDFTPIVPASKVPTFTIPATTTTASKSKKKKPSTTTQKGNNGGTLPLLRPPPPEKLRKWEEEKARPFQFLKSKKEAKEK